MGALDSQVVRLEDAAANLMALRGDVEAGVPWPLADVWGVEPEASWGPPELLAHVEEYLRYWMGEIERVLAGDGGTPVPFGRVASDTLRLGVIGRDRSLPMRELFGRIEADAARIAARLRELTEDEAARIGLHPARGELTVREMLEPFLVGHTEGHVTQLREILAGG
ncbi:MAG TPA: DinB family protein [Candidatus Dormibacteraeota bacterium]|nr:DinB family protein [Candidatus Dormibacteraeota bacterium]